ncbi:MAG: DUF11 domain-containing protein [Armatimonadetes bacterium]|nr:DUF11 domain-containing protein [Armatimonadota bacterium]
MLILAVALVLVPVPSQAQPIIVDIATNATDPFNLDDAEPSIAVNPANPLEISVVTFAEGWGPGSPGPVWKSFDGGMTWTKLFILPQPVAGSTGSGDQKIAYTADGRLLCAQLAGAPGAGIAPPRCFIYRQTGNPFAPMTPGMVYGDDQPHLDHDQSIASPFFNNRTYSPWLDFSVSNELSTVAVSPDDGATVMNVPVGDNSMFPNRTTRIALGPSGRAYVVYKTREGAVGGGFEDAHFQVARSDDGGTNWDALGAGGISVHELPAAQTWFTTSWGNAAKGPVARARSSDAWIAVDPVTEEVYVAYCDQDASGFGQVYVARSADFGMTWTSTRVTDGTHHSAYPEIAVAANGTVGVLYRDFDDSGLTTIFRVHLARSFNDGATWSDQILQSYDATPLAAVNMSDGFLWGDYEALTAFGNRFFGVFTGQSIGRTTLQFDPIFFTETALQPADLSITKTAVPNPVLTGSNVTYTITVTNNGPGPAPNVTVTDNLPATTTFVSCLATGGGVCGGSGNNRTVTFASIPAGTSVTITLVAQVNCPVPDGTLISDTATVSSDAPDPNIANNSATATTTASNPPPIISDASVNLSVLWPPNHKLVPVTVNYTITDNCGPVSTSLSVSSNEPVNGLGDGDTAPDWEIIDAHHVRLRSERSGGGNGRIYTITITATDSAGNTSTATVAVAVPHNK